MIKTLSDILERMDLQTFGEGGGAGGAAGGEGAAAPGESGAADTAKSGNGSVTDGDLSAVKYGKQEAEAEPEEADAQEPEAEPEKPAKKQSFDELLKADPEYQREMQRRIDQAINRRFAKSKAAEEQQSKLAPALNLLATKYGVAAGDTEALINAINGDSDLIEQQAMDAGMEPDAYREYQRIKAENEAFRKAAEERERQENINNMMNEWRRQEAEAKQIFPQLNLTEEIKNPQFNELLAANIDVLTAYKTVHLDEISKGLIRNAAADAQRETIAKIQQKQNRPREGAAGKPQATTVKADPTKLTRKDFDEITRRAMMGAQIKF